MNNHRPYSLQLLSAAARSDETLALPDQVEVEKLIANGLGPFIVNREHVAGSEVSSPVSRQLQKTLVMSRFEAVQREQALQEFLSECNNLKISVCLLKGVYLANFVYDSPESRTMVDIDLLVQEEDLEKVRECLFELGYIQKGRYSTAFYAKHHHDIPFYNPLRDVWIEVHRQIIPEDSIFMCKKLLAPAILSTATHQKIRSGENVLVLEAGINLVHLICHWANEFRISRGVVPLLDIVLLIKKEKNKDFVPCLKNIAKENHVIANCIYVVMSYLKRERILSEQIDVILQNINTCNSVDKIQRIIAHRIIGKYFVRQEMFGLFMSPAVLYAVWMAIITSRIVYLNIFRVLWNVVFPAQVSHRYSLGFQWRRLVRRFSVLAS